jgi:hypothetical protein
MAPFCVWGAALWRHFVFGGQLCGDMFREGCVWAEIFKLILDGLLQKHAVPCGVCVRSERLL